MTTAAVVAYYSQESVVKVSYAGHPPILYRRIADKAWSFAKLPDRRGLSGGPLENIPLAFDPETLYGQLTIQIAPGDQLFVYTDGIVEAPSPEGECFGLARLKNVLDENMKTPFSELKSVILRTLHQYTGKDLTHDDVTLIVLEIC